MMNSIPILVIVFVSLNVKLSLSEPCYERRFNGTQSFVCSCNMTHCDWFDPLEQTEPGLITKLVSDSEHRFVKIRLGFVSEPVGILEPQEGETIITIHPDRRYQTILGFGGTFTDATGINLNKLDPKLAQNVLADYFADFGLRYTMARVPIGGTDFSTRPYTYDDGQQDFRMVRFKLQPEDVQFKIPKIKQSLAIAPNPIRLFATPWSPPAWMKTNRNLTGNGRIKGRATGPYYSAYARYLIRFLKEYRAQGINFWGLTVQNQPGPIKNYTINHNVMEPMVQGNFLIKTLGPRLKRWGWNKNNFKLMIMDDQQSFLTKWSDVILSNPDAEKYISGMAFHRCNNRDISPDVLEMVHAKYPDYFFLSTEASYDDEKPSGVSLGDWTGAENYANDIITNLNHHTAGWIMDWNMVLNTGGGPNWIKNFADAPVIISDDGLEYYKQPIYYIMAHFSRFLPPGSVRLRLTINSGAEDFDQFLQATAFETPENQTVLVVLNRNELPKMVKIIDPRMDKLARNGDGGRTYFSDRIGQHSLQTYVWFHDNI